MKILITLSFLLSTAMGYAEEKPLVLVSSAPYNTFVKKIAKDSVSVELMVPPNVSSHTFEPTAKSIIRASHADIWFQTGDIFERKASLALKQVNSNMEIVLLCQGVNLICDHLCACGEHNYDPHIWLSPKETKIQAATIARTLSQHYPENQALYEKELKAFQQELTQLDEEIREQLKPLNQRVILVSHPAYAYFSRDYQLEQLPIEQEGKEPTPKYLTELLKKAKQLKIETIFAQPQHSLKGAERIASLLGADIIILDPYAQNYIENLKSIAEKIATK